MKKSDFDTLCKMLMKFPRENEDGDKFYSIEDNYIVLHTDDEYCNAILYFNDDGEFIGFIDI